MLKLIILLLAIPTGLLIRYLCQDELKSGRFWIYWLFIISVILGVAFALMRIWYVADTLFFIAIVSFISLIRR